MERGVAKVIKEAYIQFSEKMPSLMREVTKEIIEEKTKQFKRKIHQQMEVIENEKGDEQDEEWTLYEFTCHIVYIYEPIVKYSETLRIKLGWLGGVVGSLYNNILWSLGKFSGGDVKVLD